MFKSKKINHNNSGFGNLRIFIGLDAADAHCTQAKAILHDWHATFQQTFNFRC